MTLHASDVMEANVITVSPDTPLIEVHRIFDEARIHGAPVVEDDEVIGVISTLDLVHAVRTEHDATIDDRIPRYFWNEQRADVETLAGAPGLDERLSDLTAEDVMATDVIAVAPDATIPEIARIMRGRSIHRVLVVDDGHLEGIVTTFDLVELLEDPAADRDEVAVPNE